MLYEWPSLTNPIIYNNISNGLNGFQFSYDIPPSQIQVVVQAYATANLAMYDDTLWAKYRLGEIFKVQDPVTGQAAVRNNGSPARTSDGQPPSDRSNPYYSDISIRDCSAEASCSSYDTRPCTGRPVRSPPANRILSISRPTRSWRISRPI